MLDLAEALRSFIVGSGLPATTELARPQHSQSQATKVPPAAVAAPAASAGMAVPEVSPPPQPPGEDTLIKEMFADISSSTGSSVRAGRKRAGRRKRSNWGLWGVVAAGAMGISLYVMWPTKENHMAGNQSATSAPLAAMDNQNLNQAEIPSLRTVNDSDKSPPETGSNGDSSANTSTQNSDSAGSETAAKSVAPPSDWSLPETESRPSTAPSSAPSKKTPTKTTPPAPTAKDRPLIVDAKLAADLNSKIRLDGKADDWDSAKATADDLRDALDKDWSRDIISSTAEYTADSLYVMMKTSEPPSTETLAFWVNIDLNDDERYEFQIGAQA